jgi:hypothetical protein
VIFNIDLDVDEVLFYRKRVRSLITNTSTTSCSSSFSSSLLVLILFSPLISAGLSSLLNIHKIVDLHNNKEYVIDRLLKLKDKVPNQKDSNSIMYVVLSQLNLERRGGDRDCWKSNMF